MFPVAFLLKAVESWNCVVKSQPFPKWEIVDSSKLKVFADDSVKFDKNGQKFSYRVEDTGDKGEIAFKEQFILFLQCFFFKSLVLQTCKNKGLVWRGLKLETMCMW